MSRKIKFRAWDKKLHTLLLPEEWAMPMIRPDGSLHDDYGYPLENDDYIIEQYTGLRDKNGKEIYEGDIVRVNGEVALNDDICVDPIAEIVWVNEAAAFGEKFTTKRAPMLPLGLYTYEVIGNIHENPELLGGGE